MYIKFILIYFNIPYIVHLLHIENRANQEVDLRFGALALNTANIPE